MHREGEILWTRLAGDELFAEHYEILDIGPDAFSLKDEEGRQFNVRRISD